MRWASKENRSVNANHKLSRSRSVSAGDIPDQFRSKHSSNHHHYRHHRPSEYTEKSSRRIEGDGGKRITGGSKTESRRTKKSSNTSPVTTQQNPVADEKPCQLHPNIEVLSERGSVSNVRSRLDDEGSSQTRVNDQNQSYFFDRRWRACQCHLKRTTSNADIFGSANSFYKYPILHLHSPFDPPWYVVDEETFLRTDEVFRVSRERLSRIAKCHHLPRVPGTPRSSKNSGVRRATSDNDVRSNQHLCHHNKVNSNSGKNLVNRRNGSGGSSGGDDGSDESAVADSSSPSLTIAEEVSLDFVRDSLIPLSLASAAEGTKTKAELEEDLSFQILRDSETVHKYVASRGQREREEDIYEVLPPSVVIMSKTK